MRDDVHLDAHGAGRVEEARRGPLGAGEGAREPPQRRRATRERRGRRASRRTPFATGHCTPGRAGASAVAGPSAATRAFPNASARRASGRSSAEDRSTPLALVKRTTALRALPPSASSARAGNRVARPLEQNRRELQRLGPSTSRHRPSRRRSFARGDDDAAAEGPRGPCAADHRGGATRRRRPTTTRRCGRQRAVRTSASGDGVAETDALLGVLVQEMTAAGVSPRRSWATSASMSFAESMNTHVSTSVIALASAVATTWRFWSWSPALAGGDETRSTSETPVRQRMPAGSRGRRGRDDAGHHFEHSPCATRELALLAAAPEEHRVAALQARDAAFQRRGGEG